MFKKLIYVPSTIKIFKKKNHFIFLNPKEKTHHIRVQVPESIRIKKNRSLLIVSFEENYNQKNLSWIIFLTNLIKGITNPFFIRLILRGVGYKVMPHKDGLELRLGYSHSCFNHSKALISLSAARNVIIDLRSILKDSLGTEAAIIQKYRKPDVYKNKGIISKGQKLQLKLGKKA